MVVVRRRSVEDLGSGWTGVRVQTRRSPDDMPRPGDVVVVTLGRPPQKNPLTFIAGGYTLTPPPPPCAPTSRTCPPDCRCHAGLIIAVT